jgi:hypothetical protein
MSRKGRTLTSRRPVGRQGEHKTVEFRPKCILIAFLLLISCAGASAQNSTTEFFPEIDTLFKINSSVRFVFQVKDTREGGDPTQAEFGPSIEFYLKPLVKLKKITAFDLDDSKSRPLVVAIGYRYLASPEKAGVNRVEPVATFHLPTKGEFLISDRNRFDLDWSNSPSPFTWRYRNRVTVERRIRVGSYHPAPYVSAEVFYESQFNKWSTTALYAGCLFGIGKRLQLDPYYEHENNTGKRPNQQINAGGIILNLLL